MVIVDLVYRSHLYALAEALVAVVVVCYMYVNCMRNLVPLWMSA